MAMSLARVGGRLDDQIRVVRGVRVMLDADLAAAYGVSTRALNQAVKRNKGRFPSDFAFRLSADHLANLKSQSVTSSSSWGGRRSTPIAFTEHGAIMAAAVLNSRRAVDMSVFVVRAFIRLRDAVTSHGELRSKLLAIERTVGHHDQELKTVFKALHRLLSPPRRARRQIGFR
jgi:ORF6N domain